MAPRKVRTIARTRVGFTLVELMIAMAIVSGVLLMVTASLHMEARGLSDMTRQNTQERTAQAMISRIERELEYAIGMTPTAWLNEDIGAASSSFIADTTQGFPDFGTLLMESGGPNEERLSYGSFDPLANTFLGLDRGVQCTDPAPHDRGIMVRWASLAAPIEDQIAPPPNTYQGISNEIGGPSFFVGDGTGFSFRLPTDPNGGTDFFVNGNVRWGATVRGEPTLDGWCALYFEPVVVVSEAERDSDLNRDGDRADVFDLGRLRMRSWNTVNPGSGATDLALCPPMILQEQCTWAADLDDDGFDDPIFLWDEDGGRLRIRMFLLTGDVRRVDTTLRIETVIFLRNGAVQ